MFWMGVSLLLSLVAAVWKSHEQLPACRYPVPFVPFSASCIYLA